MNMYTASPEPDLNLSAFFQVLAQPARLQLLAVLAGGEACVCHLEVLAGQRQAYISQQLGVLRRAGLVVQRREGKHIYYSLKSGRVMELLQLASQATGLPLPSVTHAITLPVDGCTCPACLAAGPAGIESDASLSASKTVLQGG